MIEHGHDCGQCGTQCDMCAERERLDELDRAYTLGEGFDPWAQPVHLPRWLYVLLLAGSMFTIGMLGWVL